MKTSVIGLGKVGLPLVAVLADSGSNVVGVDYQKIINTISLDSPSFIASVFPFILRGNSLIGIDSAE